MDYAADRAAVIAAGGVLRRQVVGAGGRTRSISLCESLCWHGSYGQAVRCKNAAHLREQRLAEQSD